MRGAASIPGDTHNNIVTFRKESNNICKHKPHVIILKAWSIKWQYTFIVIETFTDIAIEKKREMSLCLLGKINYLPSKINVNYTAQKLLKQ